MIDAITARVRDGPQTGAFWDLLIGHWLWWRMWAQGIIAATPLFAGWLLLDLVSPFWAVTGAVFVAEVFFSREWEVTPQ